MANVVLQLGMLTAASGSTAGPGQPAKMECLCASVHLYRTCLGEFLGLSKSSGHIGLQRLSSVEVLPSVLHLSASFFPMLTQETLGDFKWPSMGIKFL